MEWIVIGLVAWGVVAVGGCFLIGATIRGAVRNEAARRRIAWDPETDDAYAPDDPSATPPAPGSPTSKARRHP